MPSSAAVRARTDPASRERAHPARHPVSGTCPATRTDLFLASEPRELPLGERARRALGVSRRTPETRRGRTVAFFPVAVPSSSSSSSSRGAQSALLHQEVHGLPVPDRARRWGGPGLDAAQEHRRGLGEHAADHLLDARVDAADGTGGGEATKARRRQSRTFSPLPFACVGAPNSVTGFPVDVTTSSARSARYQSFRAKRVAAVASPASDKTRDRRHPPSSPARRTRSKEGVGRASFVVSSFVRTKRVARRALSDRRRLARDATQGGSRQGARLRRAGRRVRLALDEPPQVHPGAADHHRRFPAGAARRPSPPTPSPRTHPRLRPSADPRCPAGGA